MMRKYSFIFVLLIGLLQPAWGQAVQVIQSKQVDFVVEKVTEGLGVPWAMVFITPKQMLITEREGRARLFNLATGKLELIKGTPRVKASGQGGLLDVAVPPGFTEGEWIYFTYVKDKRGQGVTVLARAKLKTTRLVNWQNLLVTQSATEADKHFGSRIAFDADGHVYFTIGDRGVRPNSQDLSNHAGSVIRLKVDGRIPADNPFVKQKEALPEIWSYGHRNPQGISYDRKNKRLWLIEHGPRGGDELNLVLPGRNYGWPVISYGKEYWGPFAVGEGTEREGMEQPVKQYTPSIAPGSLLMYSGKAFPTWKDNLFSGALKLRHLNRVVIDKDGKAIAEERLLGTMNERIRALAESPEGWIYLSTDSGKILRIKPAK